MIVIEFLDEFSPVLHSELYLGCWFTLIYSDPFACNFFQMVQKYFLIIIFENSMPLENQKKYFSSSFSTTSSKKFFKIFLKKNMAPFWSKPLAEVLWNSFRVLRVFLAFQKLETAGLTYDCHAQLNCLIDHLVLNGR